LAHADLLQLICRHDTDSVTDLGAPILRTFENANVQTSSVNNVDVILPWIEIKEDNEQDVFQQPVAILRGGGQRGSCPPDFFLASPVFFFISC